jgi:hypothetical protein
MNFAAISEFYGIFVSSFEGASLWLLVAAVPWVTTALVRLVRGPGSLICITCGGAAVIALLFWFVTLMTVDAAAQSDAVNTWFLLFLYYSLPVWLMIWSVFGATAYVYRLLTGVKPEDDDEEDEEERTS